MHNVYTDDLFYWTRNQPCGECVTRRSHTWYGILYCRRGHSWNFQGRLYINCLIPRTTVMSLSAPRIHAARGIMRYSLLNVWKRRKMARAITSVFIRNTRWGHSRSRGETKYRLSCLTYLDIQCAINIHCRYMLNSHLDMLVLRCLVGSQVL